MSMYSPEELRARLYGATDATGKSKYHDCQFIYDVTYEADRVRLGSYDHCFSDETCDGFALAPDEMTKTEITLGSVAVYHTRWSAGAKAVIDGDSNWTPVVSWMSKERLDVYNGLHVSRNGRPYRSSYRVIYDRTKLRGMFVSMVVPR